MGNTGKNGSSKQGKSSPTGEPPALFLLDMHPDLMEPPEHLGELFTAQKYCVLYLFTNRNNIMGTFLGKSVELHFIRFKLFVN